MPSALTYPGVYIEEISSGVRTITGVATSITAFIGRAARGLVNEPVVLNSFADFERTFGGLQQDFLLSYAVRDFYLNGGSQAIVVRLLHPNFANDGVRDNARAAAKAVVDATVGPSVVAAAKTAADTANATIAGGAGTPAEKAAAKAVADAVDAAAVVAGAAFPDISKAANGVAAGVLAAADSVVSAITGSANVPAAKTAADTANATIAGGAGTPAEKAAAKAVADAVDAAAGVAGANLSDVQQAANDVRAKILTALKTVTDATGDLTVMTAAKTAADNAVAVAGTPADKTAAQAVADAVDPAATGATVLGLVTEAQAAAAGAVPSKAKLNLPTDTASPPATEPLVIEAASEGAWGNNLRARVDYDGLASVGDRFKPLTSADLFNLTVRDMATGVTERFLNLSVKDSPRRIDRVLENQSNLVRQETAPPTVLPRESDIIMDAAIDADATIAATDKAKAKADARNISPFSADDLKRAEPRTAGIVQADFVADGGPLDRNDISSGPNLQDNKRGIYALDKADLFNLLCLPPQLRDASTDPAIYQDALPYCVQRRAMLIVDSPAEWSVNKDTAAATAKADLAALNLNGEAARNAALFFPRVIQSDPARDGQPDTFVPCGIVAGVMARTDSTRGVWKAPAGLDASLAGIQGLDALLSDGDNGILNQMGINCLRTFPISGSVVWGSRTLRGADQLADEYKYIPVRRTALFIEESLYRGSQWVVFEPNDEPLWAQIRLNVGAFMHNLFRQGAFQGTTPRDAYFVKCDKETTTQNDIDLGIVNIVVGFAPLKPAEFVVIKLQQIAGQIAV